MEAVRIAVVDDHPLFREGVARSLAEIGGFEIVGEGSCADDALRIAGEGRSDVILLDISMPGGGLNAVASIRQARPSQKVVMLTVSESGEDVARALRCGARGYVLKGVGARALADVIRAVAAGENYVSPGLSARLLADMTAADDAMQRRNVLAALTPREAEILRLVGSGFSNKRVALELGLQEKTVKHHMTRIMAKLGASNRTEAAIAYREIQAP